MNKLDIKAIFSFPRKRKELPVIFNTDDRGARIIITKLQEKYILINLQDGRGYFIGDSKDGIKYSFQELSRGKSSIEKVCNILAQCDFENIDELQTFVDDMTFIIGMLHKTLVPLKNRLYKAKNIKCVLVTQHNRRVGTGDLDGQVKWG